MNEPEWIRFNVLLAIHEAQLAEHGGLPGMRDQGMLEAALARPIHLFTSLPQASLRQLAAAYAFGLAKNHGFVDGNKRAAWVVCALFLELNGVSVIAEQTEVVRVFLGLAGGSLAEQDVLSWLESTNVTL